MTVLPQPSLGWISAQCVSWSSVSHTDLLIMSISGPAWKRSSVCLSANDSRHDGGRGKEDTACHFDSCYSGSNGVAPRQVSPVVISLPKWHLKCEATAVLVAQSPQAEPWTWAANAVPSFAARSRTQAQIPLEHKLAAMIEKVESDLDDRYSQCSDGCVCCLPSFPVCLVVWFHISSKWTIKPSWVGM